MTHRHRSPLIFALLLILGGLGQPAQAQPPAGKTPTERWLDTHRDPHQKRYFGEPIDLSLRRADLVEVLRSFAEIGRFNLIIQPGVEGTVTVELKQVPWDQALEQILKINGLAMEITGGKVNVAPRAGGVYETLGFDLLTVRLKPVYADPTVIARALDLPNSGVPGPGGALRVEGRSLVIRDTREALQDFARVLSYVDVPAAAEESREDLARRCVELWNRYIPDRPLPAPETAPAARPRRARRPVRNAFPGSHFTPVSFGVRASPAPDRSPSSSR